MEFWARPQERFDRAQQNAIAQLAYQAQNAPAPDPQAAQADLRRQMIEIIPGRESDFGFFGDIGDSYISAYIGNAFALLIVNDRWGRGTVAYVYPFVYDSNTGYFNRLSYMNVGDSRGAAPSIFIHPQNNAFSVHTNWFYDSGSPPSNNFTTYVLQNGQFVLRNTSQFGDTVAPSPLGMWPFDSAVQELEDMTPLIHRNISSEELDNIINIAGVVFPWSSQTLLNEWDFENLLDSHLRIARNEIFARHGRMFYSRDLQDHFNRLPWYNGHIAPANWSDSVLNAIEQQNIARIQAEEARR